MAKCTVKEIRAEEEAIRRKERKEKMLEQKRKNREVSEAQAKERAVRQKVLEELLKVTEGVKRDLESKVEEKNRRYKCECGAILRIRYMQRHENTLRHRLYLESKDFE